MRVEQENLRKDEPGNEYVKKNNELMVGWFVS